MNGIAVLLFLLASSARADDASNALSRLSDGLEASAIFDGRLPRIDAIADDFGGPVIWAGFKLDKILSPYQPFTRPASRVDWRPLREQAAAMDRDIRSRFLVADGRIFVYSKPIEMGDMAIWQGAYASMEILKHAWDGAAESQDEAEKAFDGMALMYKPGLPLVRGILPEDLQAGHPKEAPYHREGGMQWVEDASIDSTTGWLLGVILAERKLPSRRAEAQELLRRFAQDLIDNKFRLKNGDGSKTKLGDMAGDGFTPSPVGALVSIAALNECERISPSLNCREARDSFADRHKDVLASFASGPGLGFRNVTTNHNIGFLALTSALLSEEDAERWLLFARGIVRLARNTEQDGNSFWIYLSYWALEQKPWMLAFHSGDPALTDWMAHKASAMALAKKPMLEFDYPNCKLAYERINSNRTDIKLVKWPTSSQKFSAQPLPTCQKGGSPASDFVWQRNRHALDDWGGWTAKPAYEFTGMDFLFAYYLGLHDGGLDAGE